MFHQMMKLSKFCTFTANIRIINKFTKKSLNCKINKKMKKILMNKNHKMKVH